MKSITIEEFESICEKVKEELLEPTIYGQMWFNGSREELDDWAGDVFYDAIEKAYLHLGVFVEDEEE